MQPTISTSTEHIEQTSAQEKSDFPSVDELYASYFNELSSPYRFSSDDPAILWPRLILSNQQYPYPTWASDLEAEHHPRTMMICELFQRYEETRNFDVRNLVDLILGPRLGLAIANAARKFLDPRRHAIQQLSLTIKTFIQITGLMAPEREAFLKETHSYRVLEVLLIECIQGYTNAFPTLASSFRAISAVMFENGRFKTNLLAILHGLDKALRDRSHHDLKVTTLRAYETMEIHEAHDLYRHKLTDYLNTHKEDTRYFCPLIGEETEDINIIVEKMLTLPAMIPASVSRYFLRTLSRRNLDMAVPFLYHGANIADLTDQHFTKYSESYWKIMGYAIKTYRCTEPKDSLLCQQLERRYFLPEIYAKETKEQWITLVTALSRSPNEPVYRALHRESQEKERWKLFKSHLYGFSDRFYSHQSIPPSPIVALHRMHRLPYRLPKNTIEIPHDVREWNAFFKALPQETDQTVFIQGDWFEEGSKQISAKINYLVSYLKPHMTGLWFPSVTLNDAALEALVRQRGFISSPLKHIRMLNLISTLITDTGIKKLSASIHRWTALEVIDLRGTLITEEGVKELIAVLHDTRIHTVLLNIPLSESTRNRLDAQLSLNREESKTPHSPPPPPKIENDLVDATLRYIEANENRDREVLNIMRTMTNIEDIEHQGHVDLSMDRVGDQTSNIQNMIHYLRIRDHHLVSLSLEGQPLSNISDEAFSELMTVLSRFGELQTLNFNRTGISEIGTHAHEECKGERPQTSNESRMAIMARDLHVELLKVILLNDNKMSEDDIEFLDIIVKKHSKLKEFHIDFKQSQWLFVWYNRLKIKKNANQALPSFYAPHRHLELSNDIQTPLIIEENRKVSTWFSSVSSDESSLTFILSRESLKDIEHLRAQQDSHFSIKVYRETFERYLFNLIQSAETAIAGDMTVNPGVLKQMTDLFLSSVISTVSSTASQVFEMIAGWKDDEERQSYFDTVSKVGHMLGRGEERTAFVQLLSSLIIEQYVYHFCTEELTEARAIQDAFTVRDFMAYGHFTEDPLFEVKQVDRVTFIHCHRMTILIYLLMGQRRVVVPVPINRLNEFHECQSTPQVRGLIRGPVLWEVSVIVKSSRLPFVVTERDRYMDLSIVDDDLKKLEGFLRDIFYSAANAYKEKHFLPLGYYERFFMPLLTRHGGAVSIADCNLLMQYVKEKSFPDFIQELRVFIQERQGHSGQSADSLFSLFLQELLRPIKEQGTQKQSHEGSLIDLSFFSTTRRHDLQKATELFQQLETTLVDRNRESAFM
ncbi:MAG: hypothetical protein LRY67_07710 [Gammaproteobacteria bacterium]|nr:hypothetical protein [Gammaproteobacteria bacterium]